MGNICCPRPNKTIVKENGVILKKCSKQDIQFWDELNRLKFILTSEININKRTVEFNYTNIFFENFISIGQILEYLIVEQNFFYFFTLFEILIALIDFLQVVFALKNKYKINMDNFFMINFEKFYMMKDLKVSNHYSRLVYLDDKINDDYTLSELMYKDDINSGIMSFSIDETGKSVQNFLSTMNTQNFKSTVSIDLNSAFYSKSNQRYSKLRANYTLDECQRFYAENFLNFILKFFLKRVNFIDSSLEHEYHNLKFILRNTMANVLKNSGQDFNLQILKVALTNFYLNNNEFKNLKEKVDRIHTQNLNTSLNKLIDFKLLSFQRAGIQISYGDCDIVYEGDKNFHKICFIYDNLFLNKYSHSVCIDCADFFIFKKCPENRSDNMTLKKYETELLKKNSYVDFRNFLKYLCFHFSKYEIDDNFINEEGEDIYIFVKNRNTIAFEQICWDEYREEVLSNQILNLDIYVKNNVKIKKNNVNSMIIPMNEKNK